MSRTRVARILVVAFAFTLAALPLAAEQSFERSPSELRAILLPTYEAMRDDPKMDQLDRSIVGKHDDPAAIDAYLQQLPMSPLDFLEIDMKTRFYEFGIPYHIAQWHERWIQLHQDKARALYGDAKVDAVIAGWVDDPGAVTEGDAPTKMATVGTNRNSAATSSPSPELYQGEIQVAVNPNDTNQIVSAANTWDSIGGTCAGGIQAVFYSSDGGDTWDYTCPPLHTAYGGFSCAGTVFGSDPALAWNDNNEVFLNHMMICSLGANNTLYAMVVARSTNGGATWNAQGVIKNSWGTGDLEDKNFYIVDNTPTSPFYGRHYTCWDRNNNEKMAWSSNNGVTWNEVDLPTSSGNGSGTRFDLGCDLAVTSNGDVHVVFDTLSCTSNCNNEEMFYTRSTNGGASWSSPVEVRDFSLIAFGVASAACPDAQNNRCIGPFGGIAADASGGSCDGTLYATFSDFVGGEDVNDSDVWVSRSTNNGATWQAAVKVNDDGLNNRVQFHPFVQVDQSNGDVVVGWHDARNDSGNDAIDYFVARSTDCGVSFEANIQASQPSSEFNNSGISSSNMFTGDNSAANPNQYGEYMGVDAMNGKAYLAWSDTRHYYPGSSNESQDENVGFAIVDFGGGTGATCGNSTIEPPELCDGSSLGGETCTSQGFDGGTLACNGTCNGFDTSGCFNNPVCGNNVIETGEVCDGTDLGGQTCVSQGFTGGTLSCNVSCGGFDTSNCTTGGGGLKIWMSFRSNTAVPGVGTVTDDDIVSYDESTGLWAKEFDGSDVGLGGLEISGLAILPGGDLLLSFTQAGTAGGLSIDDSDIVRFTPTSLGNTTAGTFSVYFDGSDVNLTSNGEDVDAIDLASDGRLVISTTGGFSGSGASGADEDLFVFTGTLGTNTSGSFTRIFDGSDVALNGGGAEDVDAASVTGAGNLLFSTVGNFSVSGLTGADEDIVEFSGTFGNATSGSFSMRQDLSTLGIIANEDIGSLHIVE